MRSSARTSYLLGCVLAFLLFGIAIYLQYVSNLAPCPLCQLQRLLVVVLGVIFFIAAIHNPSSKGIKAYGFLSVLFAGLGVILAGRQVWLQSLPMTEVGSCGVGLDYLLNTLPISEVVKEILRGAGSCSEVSWTFLGLSVAAWSLISFLVLGTLGFCQVFRRS